MVAALAAGVVLIVLVIIAWTVDTGPEPQAGGTTSPSPAQPSGSPSPSAGPTATSSTGKQTAVPSPSLGTPSAVGSGRTVPVEPVRTKKAVPLDKTGDFGTGLTVRLSRIAAVKGKATAPGEVAGPAIKVTVIAQNRADRAIDLNSVVVFVSLGTKHMPASELSEGARPLTGRLAPQKSQTGTYIYTVPEKERKQVRVEISYSSKAPTVAFEGPVEG